MILVYSFPAAAAGSGSIVTVTSDFVRQDDYVRINMMMETVGTVPEDCQSANTTYLIDKQRKHVIIVSR